MTRDELREYLLQNQDATGLDLSGKELTELPPEIGQEELLVKMAETFLEEE